MELQTEGGLCFLKAACDSIATCGELNSVPQREQHYAGLFILLAGGSSYSAVFSRAASESQ